MNRNCIPTILVLLAQIILTACAQTPTGPQAAESPGVQLLRTEPPLQNQRHSVLLDFESDADREFISAQPEVIIDSQRAHTGRQSLKIGGTTRRVMVDLPALLSSRAFPADWTLAGAYFYAGENIEVRVSYQLHGKIAAENEVILAGGSWTAADVDLTGLSDAPAEVGQLVFEFLGRKQAPVWCDDVMLVDNDQTLVDDNNEQSPLGVWSIQRHGFNFVIQRPGRPRRVLRTSEAAVDGWRLIEVSKLRARFERQGSPANLTIYADGREFQDGRYDGQRVISDPLAEDYPQSHASPGEISVPPEQGRRDRNTPGDLHNTGYNENMGSYELVAFGRNLEIQMTPAAQPMARPVFEIAGLPQGKVLATLQGQLIETFVRLPNGHLLIELPVKIFRPAILNVRVE